MQSHSNFPIVLSLTNYNGEVIKYHCKEVKVPNTSYFKLITSNGEVAILYSPGYGSGWSTDVGDREIKKQFIFDSNIVRHVTSKEFKHNFTEEKYVKFMKTIFPSYESEFISFPNFDSFLQLMVTFVPVHTQFRINEYDGSESVEIFDPTNYFLA
jgi:hypothetical protein